MKHDLSEFMLKFALAEEYEQAVRWKREYEALTEQLLGAVKEFLRYCERSNFTPSNDKELTRIMLKIHDILTDETLHGDDRRGLDRTILRWEVTFATSILARP